MKVQTVVFAGHWWFQPISWVTIGFLMAIFFSPWGPVPRYCGWSIALVALLILCLKGQWQGGAIARPVVWILGGVLTCGALTTAVLKQNVYLWAKGFSQPVEFAFAIWLAAWVFLHVKNGIHLWLRVWYAGTVVFLFWGIVQLVKDPAGELLFSNVNSLGLYICLVMPLLLGAAFREAPRSRLVRIGELGMVAVALLFLFLSFTITAWATVGLQLVLFFLLLPHARLKLVWLGGAILTAGLIFMVLMQLQHSFLKSTGARFEYKMIQLKRMLLQPLNDDDPARPVDSVEVRLGIAQISVMLFKERPLFGWGWGKYGQESVIIARQSGFEGRHPDIYAGVGHSMYLNLMVRGGLVALLGVVALHALGVVRLWQTAVPPPWGRELAVPAMILVVSFFLYSLGGDIFDFRYKAAILLWSVLGLAFVRGAKTARDETSPLH